jgi:hypothetical protein
MIQEHYGKYIRSDGDALLRSYAETRNFPAVVEKTGTFGGTYARGTRNYAGNLARPTGIEPVLRVPETLVISFSLRARGKNFYHRVAVQSTRVFLYRGRDTHHFFVNQAIGRECLSTVHGKGLPGKIAESTTGFGRDQGAGGNVPRFELQLPESIESAAGHIAKIEGRGTAAPNALAADHEFLKVAEIDFGEFAPIVGKTGGEQRLVQLAHRRDAQCFAVESRALAEHRFEHSSRIGS